MYYFFTTHLNTMVLCTESYTAQISVRCWNFHNYKFGF